MESSAGTPVTAASRGSGLGGAPAAIDVVPSAAALGAEVRGIDLSAPVRDDIKATLRQAWSEHLVLLFRAQDIDDDQLLAAAGIFGPPQEAASRKYHLGAGRQVDNQFMISKHASISIVSNLGPDGNPVRDNGSLGSYEVVWHTDNSYVDVPPAGSMLYALEIPRDGSGETWFSNQYLAYEELPADLKRAIEGKRQVHDSSRNSAGILRPGVKMPTCPEEVEGPAHPLVRVHPVTGRRALYLGRRRDWPSNYVVGMPNDESERLLDSLWAHATQPKYAWRHQWRVGDLVLWDNRCCMHYRSAVDATQPRIMHRTTIRGEPVIPG